MRTVIHKFEAKHDSARGLSLFRYIFHMNYYYISLRTTFITSQKHSHNDEQQQQTNETKYTQTNINWRDTANPKINEFGFRNENLSNQRDDYVFDLHKYLRLFHSVSLFVISYFVNFIAVVTSFVVVVFFFIAVHCSFETIFIFIHARHRNMRCNSIYLIQLNLIDFDCFWKCSIKPKRTERNRFRTLAHRTLLIN